MKKILIAFLTVCAFSLSFGLTACGRGYAKIVGIDAGMVAEQDHTYYFDYSNPLSDNQTLLDRDYVLQVGENYFLAVTYIQTGGSRVASIHTDEITLKYDTEVLDITPPEEKEGMEVFYNLTCKKEVSYTAVIIEVNEYACTVIISAE